jgi:hypothetical protein
VARCLIALVLVAGLSAQAHDADVVAVLVSEPVPGRVTEVVTLTGGTLSLLAPVDVDGDRALSQADLDAAGAALAAGVWADMPLTAAGTACARGGERAQLNEGSVTLQAAFSCGPGELRQDFRWLRVLPANYRVAVRRGEGRDLTFLQGAATSTTIARDPLPPDWVDAAMRGFDAGVLRVIVLDVLAALIVLGFAASSWRFGLQTLAVTVVGVVASSLVASPPLLATLAIALLSVVLAGLAGRDRWWWGLLLGLAIGARDGGGAPTFAMGVGLGSAMIVVPCGITGIAVGQILGRSPRAQAVGRWAMASLAAFGAGFRLTG